MDNDKYGLHTIDYSIQGWDAIMAADMEIINAMIPTRIIGTLGETVVAYEALYLKTADGKWYKALADGVKQPCLGLAVEGGDDTDEIRIHRLGEIINTGWAWVDIGKPIYLDPLTPGALTQTIPYGNTQIIGYALSATKMLGILFSDLPYIWTINVNTTGVSNIGSGEDDLMTFSLPAKALNVNAKGIRVIVYGTIAATASAKTVKVYFGSTVIYSASMTPNQGYTWTAQFTVIRTGEDTQDVFGTGFIENIAMIVAPYFATDTQDDGAAIVIKCTGEGQATNDIVQQGMLIEYI